MKRIPFTAALSLLVALSVSGVEFRREQAGRIAQATGDILDTAHYRRLPLDDAMSRKHLDNYLNQLDYLHLFFLEGDVTEFRQRYQDNLDDRTRKGDVEPAYVIFTRFLQRLNESVARVDKLLADTFDFTRDERYLPARHEQPWPKDAAEADEFWRLRIKYELLQGKLAAESKSEGKSAAPEDGKLPKVAGTKPAGDSLKKLSETIGKRYQRMLRNYQKFDSSNILETYLTALGRGYDPHSGYMAPAEAENFDIHNVKLQLTGIGAVLSEEDGYTSIKELSPGGPAARGKELKPDDRIIAVAQGDDEPVDVVDMKLSDVVQLIRGEKGTTVKLTIIPAGADNSVHKVVSLVRDVIKLQEQFAKGYVIETPRADGTPRRVGVVDLPQFYDKCSDDVAKLIKRMEQEKIEGVILDLRRNGGGLLTEAVNLAGLFIRQGAVVQVKDTRGRVFVLDDENEDLNYDGPLMVMVGRYSASASEIVAAALQDYGRALVVGDNHTHGKGTVQTLFPLVQWLGRKSDIEDPGRLKFTIQKFYRIAGGTTQKDGVLPDLVLPNVLNHFETGEAYLPNVLEPDKIAPVNYQKMTRVDPYLPHLKKNLQQRVTEQKDFNYILEDIALYKKQIEDKTLSLNEAVRRKEKQAAEERHKARETERDARPGRSEKVSMVKFERQDGGEKILYLPLEKRTTKTKANPGEDDESALPDRHALPASNDLLGDVHLMESAQILADYVVLLSANKLAAGPPAATVPGQN